MLVTSLSDFQNRAVLPTLEELSCKGGGEVSSGSSEKCEGHPRELEDGLSFLPELHGHFLL